jgi:RHS repeat-associated protein
MYLWRPDPYCGSESTANSTTVWKYDKLGRITSTNGKPQFYNSHGKPATVTDMDGNVSNYQYDELGRLVYEEVRNRGDVVLASYTYELDTLGNRIRLAELSGKTNDYEYDELNRLTREISTVEGMISTTVYTYDATGNRLTKTVDGAVTTYAYDVNDRMTSDGVQTYTYDSNGNTLSDGTKTFSYDSKNSLESFESVTDTVTYTYDTDNLRTSKTVNGSTTNYVLCKTCRYARVIEELDGDTGALEKSYTYGNSLLGYGIEGGLDHGFVLDGHGSVRKVTYNGIIQAEYDYSAYGELTSETGWAVAYNDFRYSGEQYDPHLDQYYLRARYYNQNVGRFSSMDDWGGVMSRPLSLNKYNYTESNPVMGIDPSGKFTFMGLLNIINVKYVLALTAIPMIVGCSRSGCEDEEDGDIKLGAYITELDAVAKVVAKYNKKSVSENKEYCGWIYQLSGTHCFYSTKAIHDASNYCRSLPSRPSGNNMIEIANWHTHADRSQYYVSHYSNYDGNEHFSTGPAPSDEAFYNANNVNKAYMMSSSYALNIFDSSSPFSTRYLGNYYKYSR